MKSVEENVAKYIILRNDKKLSGEVLTLEEAQDELKRWETILKRWPDGSKVRIEEVKN